MPSEFSKCSYENTECRRNYGFTNELNITLFPLTNSRRRFDRARKRVRRVKGHRRQWYTKTSEEAALKRVLLRLKEDGGLVPSSSSENRRKGMLRELLLETHKVFTRAGEGEHPLPQRLEARAQALGKTNNTQVFPSRRFWFSHCWSLTFFGAPPPPCMEIHKLLPPFGFLPKVVYQKGIFLPSYSMTLSSTVTSRCSHI